MPTTPLPVYELAGQQDDGLAERVLALLFTDQPVRTTVRPGDTRRHWQFFARTDTENQGSRIWIELGEPITDDAVRLIKTRGENALEVLLSDGTASSVDVQVQQTAFDTVAIAVKVARTRGGEVNVGVTLAQGDG